MWMRLAFSVKNINNCFYCIQLFLGTTCCRLFLTMSQMLQAHGQWRAGVVFGLQFVHDTCAFCWAVLHYVSVSHEKISFKPHTNIHVFLECIETQSNTPSSSKDLPASLFGHNVASIYIKHQTRNFQASRLNIVWIIYWLPQTFFVFISHMHLKT